MTNPLKKTSEQVELENKALESPSGGISSTRVNEKKIIKFTLWYIVIFGALIFGYSVLSLHWQKDTQGIVLDTLLYLYMFTLVSLFISAFTPKMWGKATELLSLFSKNRNGVKK